MRKSLILKILLPLGGAPFFGAVYWAFLEGFQPGFVDALHGTCCARCANILYDREQLPLAFCAAVAFALLTCLANAKGLKGILKTLLITYLIFQIYSLLIIWSVANAQECTALHRVRAPALASFTILIVYLLIVTGFWASAAAAPIAAFNLLRAIVFTGKDDSDPLDLGLK